MWPVRLGGVSVLMKWNPLAVHYGCWNKSIGAGVCERRVCQPPSPSLEPWGPSRLGRRLYDPFSSIWACRPPLVTILWIHTVSVTTVLQITKYLITVYQSNKTALVLSGCMQSGLLTFTQVYRITQCQNTLVKTNHFNPKKPTFCRVFHLKSGSHFSLGSNSHY